jgi:hypothetical protein
MDGEVGPYHPVARMGLEKLLYLAIRVLLATGVVLFGEIDVLVPVRQQCGLHVLEVI